MPTVRMLIRPKCTQPQSWPGPPNPRLPPDRGNAVPIRWLAHARTPNAT